MSKYKNVRTVVDDIKFSSQKEARRFKELRLLEKAGEISDLKLQVPFILMGPVIINGRRKPSLKYLADFVYVGKDGKRVVEDVKSVITQKTAVYRMKKHIMKSIFNIDIYET